MHFDQLTIPDHIISRLFVAGINYQKADISTRGLFSVDNEGATRILEEAGTSGIRSAFVLSTCNRTEIYGYCQQDQELTDLLIRHTRGNREQFHALAYRKRGTEALQHLFEVAAGLDSQIIGDNEILGQLKQSVALSRGQHMIGPIMDRTLNFAFQAAKAIKTKTQLSTGTVSVSYAAIEWLPQTSTAFATTGRAKPSPPIRVGGVHHLTPAGSSQVKVAVTSPVYQPCALGEEEKDTVMTGGSTSSVTTKFADAIGLSVQSTRNARVLTVTNPGDNGIGDTYAGDAEVGSEPSSV